MGIVKYTGPVASFHCPTNAEIRSLKVHFSPKQLGEGTPSPDNVREIEGWDGVEVEQRGKNLFDASNPNIISRNCWVSSNTPHNIIASNVDRTIYIKCLPNMTYVISKTLGNVLGAGYTTELPVIGVQTYSYMRDNYAKQVIVTTGADAKYLAIWFYDASKTFDKTVQPEDIYKTLQVEIGSTTTSYEPYHGSTTNYTFGVLGKNKFDKNSYTYLNSSVICFGGDTSSEPDGSLFLKAGTYTFSVNATGFIFASDANKQNIVSATNTNTATFTLPESMAVRIGCFIQGATDEEMLSYDYQLELGSTATAYEPYDPNKTVYGGWVDLITGEVQEEWSGSTTFDGTEDTSSNSYTKYTTYLPTNDRFGAGRRFSKKVSDGLTTIYCDSLPISYDNTPDPPYLWVTENGNYIYYIIIVDKLSEHTEITSSSDANAYTRTWLTTHNVTVKFKSTPITYSLAPTQLQTFLGQNNVWSNADYVEVEYDLHETQTILARKQFIMASQPHLEEASGNIATFNTDMVAPLKSCKIHFSPVQEGSGDPSPENVRIISGWTNLGIMHKNGLPSEYQAVEYLQSTGTQFITGYFTPPTTGTITLKVILEPESMKDNYWYCGGRSGGHVFMQVGRYVGTWYKDTDSDIYEVISVTNDIEKIFCSKSQTTSLSYDYLLFGRAWGDPTPYSCKIFQCTLYFNNNPIYNYIPCYRKVDNVAGMYDTVNNVFYTNEGTGTFITGQDIQALPQPLLFESTHSIDWGATFGTIYGGYVDLVTGEVWETWKKVNITQTMSQWNSWGDHLVYNSSLMGGVNKRKVGTTVLCDGLTPIGGTINPQAVTTTDEIRYYGVHANYPQYLFMANPDKLSIAEWRSWLVATYPDVNICYELETPTLITTMTPETLKTLRGTNNIWASNDGDNIELSYWKH